MNEPVDAAQVDERAEVRETHDDALADLPDLERVEQLLLLRLQLFFEDEPLREHDAMPLVVEIDHLQTQVLADEFVEVADRLTPDLRRRHEAAHPEIDENAALDDLRDGRFDHFVALVRLDDLLPGLERARAALGEKERAVDLVDAMDHDFEGVADAQRLWIDGERELAEGKHAFGLAADVDEQFVLVFLDDRAGEDLALVEHLERFFVEALFERELIFFLFDRSDFSCRYETFLLSYFFIFGSAGTTRFRVAPAPFARSALAASAARLADSAVDREVVLEPTPQPVGVHVVVDARSAHFDGALQNVDDRAA